MNIHEDLIPNRVKEKMRRDGHLYHNIGTVKQWLDYMLFTFLAKIEVGKTVQLGNPVYEMILWNLSKKSQKNSIYSNPEEGKTWDTGMYQALVWVNNNRSYEYAVDVSRKGVWTESFGRIDIPIVDSLKKFVSSPSTSTTDSFKLDHRFIKFEMAKRLITYYEWMIGISTPTIKAAPIPARVLPTEFELVDDTESFTGTSTATAVPTAVSASTVIADPVFIDVDPNIPVDLSGLPPVLTREYINDHYGIDLVDFLDDQYMAGFLGITRLRFEDHLTEFMRNDEDPPTNDL